LWWCSTSIPNHGSVPPEILSRYSSLPVAQIGNDTEIEPNHVYVIPPKATLTIRDGHLMLAARNGSRVLFNSIDEFFTSLATDRAEDAACVILSGTGSDSTPGLRAIKEHGGLTIAQAEAEYDGMMRSVVSTGLVGFVLRCEEIPGMLVEYFQRATRAESEAEASQVRNAEFSDCFQRLQKIERSCERLTVLRY
jgi:two-component system, chemotaxis family, CheB/CheR fusion protein